MSYEKKGRRVWIKPEVKELGGIRDVAGAQVPKAQSVRAVKS